MPSDRDIKTAKKFSRVVALIERGATDGERTAARRAGERLIARFGIWACLPSHPLNNHKIVGCEWDLVDVVESMWATNAYGTSTERVASDVVWWAFFAALPQYGAKTVGRALCILKARQRVGWVNGRWTGGNDLKFLGVTEWGLERAFRRAAEMEGWTKAEVDAFIASRTATIAAHLAEYRVAA